MRQNIQEIARNASAAHELDGFWSLIHGQLEQRGVSGVLFGVFASTRELEHLKLSKALIWKSSYKQEFFDAFDEGSLLDNDVTAEHCVRQNDLLFWHDMNNWQNASPMEIKRANIERDLGFAIGFTVPSSFYFPNQSGGIGISMPNVPVREFERFWKQEGRDLVTICGILDAGMRGQHMSEFVNLSKREVECLTWLAVGLRPEQIADRFGIGDKSIEKYIAGARRKLKARTRDHAVAKALMFGLINP